MFAYLRHGVLQVSVDLDDVDPATSPFAVYGERGCVPMHLEVHGQTVFSAFQPGGPHDHRARRHADPAAGRPLPREGTPPGKRAVAANQAETGSGRHRATTRHVP